MEQIFPDTADYFSDLVKIDFHDESPVISSSPTDFVFSNSWDHSTIHRGCLAVG